MCGIVGLYRWAEDPEVVRTHVRTMCRAIVHRGPDDEGLFAQESIGLGMRRLSIIDVGGGHQPIDNEDGTVTVVFNGEIYNFHALRDELERRGHRFKTKSDTEVIVHAYEEDGPDCVKHFNGMFAFAVWDHRRQRLFLARDRMGIKPLYYVQLGGKLAFASEIKALLALPEVSRVLDMESAARYFRLGFVPAPDTLFQDIRKLPAGWSLTAEKGRVDLHRYWDWEFKQPTAIWSFEESRDRLRDVLREAVVDQMVSDVPLGAFLSGGVDSTGIVAFMREASTHRVQTFSIGFDARHAYHNEAPFAEAAAKALGTKHETLIVHPNVVELLPELIEKLDEPLTDTSFILSYLVSELAHRHVKVALSGLGGDELFGGYRRYLGASLWNTLSWIPAATRQAVGSQLERRLSADRGSVFGNLGRYGKALGRALHLSMGEQYLSLLSVLSAEQVNALLSRPLGSVDPGEELVALYEQAAAVEPVDRLAYVDAKTVLPESLLLLSDKMGMATSLEVRVPFLDNRVVDFVAQVPSRYRLRRFQLKRLLKAALKGVVPDFVLNRSKRGFGTPMGTWLREDLKPMVAQMLDPERLRRGGLFNPDTVRTMLAVHDARKEDLTEGIMALVVFELWRERFQVRLP
ncbi:asparagine synthase (glutamine-hydrolyzing) [Nitrospira moscoviensis]|uniref:asparagine synthase (glutamine-hydrolyzing) n=1 Tax=Nitrospira moscoviensis TaxID=42253 RepID=A0A0K2GG08_NITMO|nr:asparagine synthase (glutamine-hydrolyzing) [Nitrospira moscoviensis]ALA59789.1 Asparagine synthetase [Nitrospira moscoviensis]